MRQIEASAELVARCGLYCGACGAYLNGKCDGCHKNEKAEWCKIRGCCAQKRVSSCAECAEHPDPRECAKFHNFMSKIFALVFRSDRAACIDQIRRLGLAGHAQAMAERKLQSIRR
jgi:hypothetical protein